MEEKIETQKKTGLKRKKTKPINYKAESLRYKSELEKLQKTVKIDLDGKISIDFSLTDLFWMKSLIGKELTELEGDLVTYDNDDKLPATKQGHKFILNKIKVLENIYRKIDCLTI